MNRGRISRSVRREVVQRAGGLCEYCLCREDYSPVMHSVEHIIPKSRGGTDNLNNLALACQECNNHKFDKMEAVDSLTETVVPLFHPRQHLWREHFAWSEDSTHIVGLTPIGRATVAALQLNRSGLINLRAVLHPVGKHPPKFSQE